MTYLTAASGTAVNGDISAGGKELRLWAWLRFESRCVGGHRHSVRIIPR